MQRTRRANKIVVASYLSEKYLGDFGRHGRANGEWSLYLFFFGLWETYSVALRLMRSCGSSDCTLFMSFLIFFQNHNFYGNCLTSHGLKYFISKIWLKNLNEINVPILRSKLRFKILLVEEAFFQVKNLFAISSKQFLSLIEVS